MIPKTELRYSSIYNKKFGYSNITQLKKNCKNFEKIYNKHIKDILKLIQQHNKGKWKYDLIPIYIVAGDTISFSDPLTLRYKKNPKFMLVILAHELLHNHITKKFKSSKELHMYMEPILNKVINNLPIDLNKELAFFNKRINKNLK